jgi:hypothetical protein
MLFVFLASVFQIKFCGISLIAFDWQAHLTVRVIVPERSKWEAVLPEWDCAAVNCIGPFLTLRLTSGF